MRIATSRGGLTSAGTQLTLTLGTSIDIGKRSRAEPEDAACCWRRNQLPKQRCIQVTLVSTATQLSSHVFPPSSENDCSNRHDVGVTSVMTNRTSMARPFRVS